MNWYALSHLADHTLKCGLTTVISNDSMSTGIVLAHIAEFDVRRLFVPEAHPSMHSYCVHVLGLSEDAANKRIRVARKAREFPAIFLDIAEGRLHLSGAYLLASHLTTENAAELLTAAGRKTKAEIEALLAERFPRQDVATRIAVVSVSPTLIEHSTDSSSNPLAPGPVETPHPRVTPLAPERFAVQFTMGQEAHDKLRYAQSLLSHTVPSGGIPEVFERALDALINKLEKTKFAATSRPRTARGKTSTDPRSIPAHVKRAVRERDRDRCTFVSESGQRCTSVKLLEFDHVDPVACGGEATIDGMRLLCRVHNQYVAEQVFGAGFMERKREDARQRAAERKDVIAAGAASIVGDEESVRAAGAPTERDLHELRAAEARTADAHAAHERAESERNIELDLVHCLKGLGFRSDQAQLAVRQCATDADLPIEERLRASLKFLGARGRTYALRQAATGPGASAHGAR